MQDILKDYLIDIKDISIRDKEHAHRTYLQTLLNNIAKHYSTTQKDTFHIEHEPNNDKQGFGAPDFLILKNGLTLGYIENKRVNADLDGLAVGEQIQKYLNLSENIILTDYLRFVMITKDSKTQKPIIAQNFRICNLEDLNNMKSIDLESKAKELDEFFKLFFSKNPKSIITATEFANALAQRTKILKQALLESGDNDYIKIQYEHFQKDLFNNALPFELFCDNFAQTLTYTLFIAKLNNQTEKIDLYNAKKFIPQSFPLIRALAGFLDHLEGLTQVEWLIKEILEIINNINVSSIITELNRGLQKDLLGDYLHKDPYLHFYETFLNCYDPNLRKSKGVYYTPKPIVDFIIKSIDDILKSDFDTKNGLQEALKSKDNITLLDFATGTGNFIAAAFEKALENVEKNRVSYDFRNIVENFKGFEIMIAPYVVTHLRLNELLKSKFNDFEKENKRVEVYLTNTLIDDKKDANEKINLLELSSVEFAKEAQGALDIKRNKILIITGNPPYSGASQNEKLFNEQIKVAYKNPLDSKKSNNHLALYKDGKILKEKNPKWLLDDYVKFICFAEMKMQKQENGVFAFISNNGFIDNPTFRGMRYSLMQTFNKIYILDLHGNQRKGETKEGDQNVFDIMQGVSINIFIKTNNSKDLAKVFHYDLMGKRSGKFDFLKEYDLKSIEWDKLKPKKPFYLFIPQDENLKKEYDKGLSVNDIFRISSVGIVTGRDNLCLSSADSKESLQDFKANIKKFLSLDSESARNEFNLSKDSRDWKISYAQKELKETNNDEKNYKILNYRPFDFRWTYYTGKSKGFHCMPRGDIFSHFLQQDSENLGLFVSRQFRLNENFNATFITNCITEFGFLKCGSGGAFVFPLYLYKDALKKEQSNLFENLNDLKTPNFTQKFWQFLQKTYKSAFSPEQILGYIYAILFHKGYREKYIDFLKVDFPKVPFVENEALFLKFSKLGSKLIDTHLLKNNNEHCEGIFKDINNKTKIIKKPTFNSKENTLFINESLFFTKISKEMWEYKIGGYAVLEKYLKSHKEQELDIEHFQKVCSALYEGLKIEKEISKIEFQ